VKWAVLVVVVILAAPTVLGRFEQGAKAERRRGFLYRAVRRYGPVPVLVAAFGIAAAVVVLAMVALRG
jgi:hypothetical protein